MQWYNPFCYSISGSASNYNRHDFLFEFAYSINKSLTTSIHEKSSNLWLGKETTINISGSSKGQSEDYFEVIASKDDLLLFFNCNDYSDLEMGITRKLDRHEQTINLDILKKKVIDIFSMSGIKSGYARLIDKRALNISPVLKGSGDVHFNTVESGIICTTSVKFLVNISDDFVGALFVPSNDFLVSS